MSKELFCFLSPTLAFVSDLQKQRPWDSASSVHGKSKATAEWESAFTIGHAIAVQWKHKDLCRLSSALSSSVFINHFHCISTIACFVVQRPFVFPSGLILLVVSKLSRTTWGWLYLKEKLNWANRLLFCGYQIKRGTKKKWYKIKNMDNLFINLREFCAKILFFRLSVLGLWKVI